MPSHALDQLLLRSDEDRFLGRYQLLKPLGRGGFAQVWLARDLLGETELRKVAIKLFSVWGADGVQPGGSGDRSDEEAQARIVEEVRALCRVEHPNVVRFSGIVVDEALGVVGLVMDYLTGSTLAYEIDPTFNGPFSAAQAVDLGQQLAGAVTAIHRAKLVHRDIKPANVMHVGDTYRLIDLGIAIHQTDVASNALRQTFQLPDLPADDLGTKATLNASYIRELGKARTAVGSGLAGPNNATGSGTTGYMDPRSYTEAPTRAGDLYSLGATLYECLTGYVPAAAANIQRVGEGGGLRGAVLDGREAPPSVAVFRPDLPPALVELVDSLLSPDPSARPPSAEAAVNRFEWIRASLSASMLELPEAGPFRGLDRFEASDRGVLFGRSTEIAASLEVLRRHGALALVGPSGSGKSSLARAGVAPAILEGRLGTWPKSWKFVTVEPGSQPRARIGQALECFAPGGSSLAAEVLLGRLYHWVRQNETGVLLLLDQFEELVTLGAPDEEREWTAQFVRALSNAPGAGLCTIIGARRDLLDPLLSLPDLGRTLPPCMLLVAPMTRDSWGEVLDQALHAYRYELEDAELKHEILESIGDTPMPLVQFALTQLWQHRDEAQRRIPRAAFRQIGGVGGVLSKHADSVRASLIRDDPTLDSVLRRVLLELTTPEGTRRSRSSAELRQVAAASQVDRVLKGLTKGHLLDWDGKHYNFPHEAVIERWKALSTWVSEARADRRLLTALERDARTWERGPADMESDQEREAQTSGHGHDDTVLWRGPRLIEATRLLESAQHPLSETATRFVQAASRRNRIWRLITCVAVGAVMVAMVAGSYGYATSLSLRREAAMQQRAADERSKAAEEARNKEAQLRRRAQTAEKDANEARKKAEEAAAAYSSGLNELEARVMNAATFRQLMAITRDTRAKRGVTDPKQMTPSTVTKNDTLFGTPP